MDNRSKIRMGDRFQFKFYGLRQDCFLALVSSTSAIMVCTDGTRWCEMVQAKWDGAGAYVHPSDVDLIGPYIEHLAPTGANDLGRLEAYVQTGILP